jgi:hypothetical protein
MQALQFISAAATLPHSGSAVDVTQELGLLIVLVVVTGPPLIRLAIELFRLLVWVGLWFVKKAATIILNKLIELIVLLILLWLAGALRLDLLAELLRANGAS